ncbi:MAG: hypothetical protein JO336_24340 [Acidobacteriia bacterium]|nr:hypothetical protein [Terriglobia bacterium]MBV8902073.1 hypothetical protein [Terriglobia bacterium]
MHWNRSNVLGLAKVSCCTCHGYGLRIVHKKRELPCHCVYRAIFRACYNRFRDCVANGAHTGTVSLDFCAGKDGRRAYSRKKEEYIADFCLISRRELNDADYRIFRYHFLLGADWKLCCRRIATDRGNFFHAVYRIEQQLGKVFAELKPYGLYPLDQYFGGVVQSETTVPLPPPPAAEASISYFDMPLAEAA